jgi:hypothetical protein
MAASWILEEKQKNFTFLSVFVICRCKRHVTFMTQAVGTTAKFSAQCDVTIFPLTAIEHMLRRNMAAGVLHKMNAHNPVTYF